MSDYLDVQIDTKVPLTDSEQEFVDTINKLINVDDLEVKNGSRFI